MDMSRIGDLRKARMNSSTEYPEISFVNAVSAIANDGNGGEWLARQIDLGNSECREEGDKEVWWLYNGAGNLIARVGRNDAGFVTVLDAK
jgi:hypothetical protein